MDVKLLQALVDNSVVSSKSEGKRLLRDGAIDVDNRTVTKNVDLMDGQWIKVGKRRIYLVEGATLLKDGKPPQVEEVVVEAPVRDAWREWSVSKLQQIHENLHGTPTCSDDCHPDNYTFLKES